MIVLEDDDDLLGTIDSGKNNLELALRLADQGIPVFPCREVSGEVNGKVMKDKSPLTKRGFKDASTDWEVIRAWWRKHPKALVGMPTGVASGFAVIDLDRHDPAKDGVAGLQEIGYRHGDLTPMIAQTAGGGLHLFFKHQNGITNRDNHLPPGVDVRAEGGYIIAPGSMFPDGRRYTTVDLSLVPPPFPPALLPPERSDAEVSGDQKALGLSIDEIRAYMADLPNVDLDREQWRDVIASLNHEAMMHDENGEVRSKHEREAICAIAVEWTSRDPKYSSAKHLKEARDTFWSFKNRGDRTQRTFRSIISEVIGIRADRAMSDDDFDEMDDISMPEVDEWSEEDEDDDDLLGLGDTKRSRKLRKDAVEDALGKPAPPWVAELNERHAIARVSSKTVIMDFHPDGRVTYGNVGDLHNYYENRRVDSDGKTVPITKKWIQHKKRREYPNGIIFAPNRDVPGAYNHWQGFSVEPVTGPDPARGCKLFLRHLLDVVCCGNEEHYRYHLGWLAQMIQKPEEKPGVAIVYKGRKRIGKDTVFEYVGRLFQNHYITVANQDQMLGKFNAHQEKCLLLHMQEGFWAGSKQSEGMLKYLITSNQVMIEPKGMNAFPIPSVLRLFISSNEKWVIPATEDEGRFFVLNVSEKRRNDHEYFAALRAEMDGYGPACLLAYLQRYDISKFQVRAVPDTEALAEQKMHGLKNVERWWLDVLQRGQMDGIQNREDGIDGAVWGSRPVRISCSEFRDNYSRWMRTRRFDGDELSEIEFGFRIKKMCPEIDRKQVKAGGSRSRIYILPYLSTCRKDFEQFIGSDIHWSNDEIVEEADDL